MRYTDLQWIASIDSWASSLNKQYADKKAFRYRPLNAAKDEIRVVSFKRSKTVNAKTIHFESRIISLKDVARPDYHAVSYTWGSPFEGLPVSWDDPRATFPIFIDGKMHEIRYNLFVLLSRFYYRDGSIGKKVWYWIDAICINQSDAEEKGHQIELMPRIYRNSQLMLAWLGHELPDTAVVINTLSEAQQFLARFPTFREQLLEGRSFASRVGPIVLNALQCMFTQKVCESLTSLFLRNWFSRAWIVQEAAISPRREMIVGTYRFSFRLLEIAMALSIAANAIFGQHGLEEALYATAAIGEASWRFSTMNALVRLEDAQSSWTINKAASLPEVLWEMGFFECASPKDRIYAARGLTSDPACITTDYTASLVQVTASTTREWIEEKKSLRILGYLRPSPLVEQGLPSWAVDWTSTAHGTPVPFNCTPTRTLAHYEPDEEKRTCVLYSAGGKNTTLRVWFEDDGKTMVLDNIRFLDELEYISSNPVSDIVLEGNGSAKGESLQTLPKGSHRSKDIRFQEIIEEWTRWLQDVKGYPPLTSSVPHGNSQSSDMETLFGLQYRGADGCSITVGEAYLRTICADICYDPELPAFDYERVNSVWNRVPSFPKNTSQSEQREAESYDLALKIGQAMMHVGHKRFFLSSKSYGWIGLGPRGCLPGDRICVVDGHCVPLLLRRRLGDDERYTLVGECHIDGLMDGLDNAEDELKAVQASLVRIV